MAKDWDYAKSVKWISEHGGPQKALETLKDYYMKKGFKEGAASKNPVIVLVGAVCLATGVVGKCAYDKIVEKRILETKIEEEEQAKMKRIEAELIEAAKQKTENENKSI